MTQLFLFPYKAGSKSVKALKETMKIKSIKLNNSAFKPSPQKTVVNWGASTVPQDYCGSILNHPDAVRRASNKLTSFVELEGEVPIPRWTTDSAEANSWLDQAHSVVCRHKLNGHSGEGVEIVNPGRPVPDSPLYVQYIKKKEEYRIHVVKDDVIFVQRKARKLEVPDDQVDWKVRNLKNGFIFANQNVEIKEQAKEMAVKAVKKLGLDFGAVDVIWNEQTDTYYVLEVNTAPGLQGSTLEAYSEKLKEYM